MELLLYILGPLIVLIYKTLDHFGLVDKITGRRTKIKALTRLKDGSGYPQSWLFNDDQDSREFISILKTIRKRTNRKELKAVLKDGHVPTAITTGGIPVEINGLNPNMSQGERFYFTSTHPVMVHFGVNREGGSGKIAYAGTLGELEKWIDDKKRNIEFWVGTIALYLLSIGIIIGRFLINNSPTIIDCSNSIP